jgi:prevent-host-death family protein
MTNILTANELKTRGVTAISEAASNGDEVIITIHNKPAYVVVPVKMYNHLRECELEVAVRESREELKKGRFRIESADKHVKRMLHG